jgi:HPt (histidine-containing phosphotransfer) domain-containing protein
MDDYLTKPIRTEDLMSTLDKVGKRKLVRTGWGAPVKPRPEASVDLQAALDRLGGDRALYDELVEVFRKGCPGSTAEMQTAIEAGDFGALERTAHTLRGASSNLGAIAVAEEALELEKQARTEEIDKVTEQFKVLQKEIERMFSELETLRQK